MPLLLSIFHHIKETNNRGHINQNFQKSKNDRSSLQSISLPGSCDKVSALIFSVGSARLFMDNMLVSQGCKSGFAKKSEN